MEEEIAETEEQATKHRRHTRDCPVKTSVDGRRKEIFIIVPNLLPNIIYYTLQQEEQESTVYTQCIRLICFHSPLFFSCSLVL